MRDNPPCILTTSPEVYVQWDTPDTCTSLGSYSIMGDNFCQLPVLNSHLSRNSKSKCRCSELTSSWRFALLFLHLEKLYLLHKAFREWSSYNYNHQRQRSSSPQCQKISIIQMGNYLHSPWLAPDFNCHNGLSVLNCIIQWDHEPSLVHQVILSQLHKAYPGVTKVKSLARCFVWSPTWSGYGYLNISP